MKKFDATITDIIQSSRSADLTVFFKAVTTIGDRNSWFIQAGLLFIFFVFFKKNWVIPFKASLVLVTASAINQILKEILGRDRPLESLIEVGNNSFPSGHTMSAIALYGFLIYICLKHIKNPWLKYFFITLLFILIVLMGISRIYLGVHYPTDIIAGLLGGFLCLLIYITIFEGFKVYRNILSSGGRDA